MLSPRHRDDDLRANARSLDDFAAADKDVKSGHQVSKEVTAVQAAMLVVIVGGAPLLCNLAGFGPQQRCVLVIVSVALLHICDIMPIFCTAVFVPVLASSCAALGDHLGTVETSSILVANFFNSISFLVIGAIVISAIFKRCSLYERTMDCLVGSFGLESSVFLFSMMFLGTAVCSVSTCGSTRLLAAVKCKLQDRAGGQASTEHVAKRIFLGIAFASNVGSILLPTSSCVSLIAVAVLREFGQNVSLWRWVVVSAPLATVVVLGAWVALIMLFPCPVGGGVAHKSAPSASGADVSEKRDPVSKKELFFMFVGAAFVVVMLSGNGIESCLGNSACLCLMLVAFTFGFGFLSMEEFQQLEWELLLLVGSANVMAFLVRETAFGATFSAWVVSIPHFEALTVGSLGCIICIVMVGAIVVGHSCSAILALPLVVSIGIQLQAVETVAFLCAMAIPFGMGVRNASSGNQAAQTASQDSAHSHTLQNRDFALPGIVIFFLALVFTMTLGFGVCVVEFGMPPPTQARSAEMPKSLLPRIAKEDLPTLIHRGDILFLQNRHEAMRPVQGGRDPKEGDASRQWRDLVHLNRKPEHVSSEFQSRRVSQIQSSHFWLRGGVDAGA
jgi:phosphate transporter|eukprot:TRINITY_DN43795_c0_g1_i1.p1 TRINITY_DN43795_c0_g1~~TRINITY_DN43795_c0_g1_i1.p1  ORF type:complete len:615 (-),score=96.61 TRINITY_DN43795_c0_g1_i1:82-1926(-)